MGTGTWAWGNQLVWGYEEGMDEELREVFELAVERTATSGAGAIFDTGDSYGTGRLNGRSEVLLGDFRKKRRRRRGQGEGAGGDSDGVIIGTKLATYPWRLTRGSLVRACEASLKRLQLDRMELVQLHWPAAKYNPLQERALWEGLGDIHDKGLAQAVGVSNYGPKQLVKIHGYLRERGVPLATCQVQLSLLSYGSLQRELLAVCEDLGIHVIAYSPLSLGMLTGKYSKGEGNTNTMPRGLRSLLFGRILPRVQPLTNELEAVATDLRASPSQVAIAWCMSKGTIPIPGAKNLEQARLNFGALDLELSDQHCQALEAAAKRCTASMTTNVFQTK
ncbi:aldo/keto reductase [Chloropicon primus]|uniref:Aldo/keto reductase n=1 Tax=Chloropicon primus TaxID=1764295 RepID=A0A5B8MZV3_9CHLO|nr:aldo/keto reductase [Chloropicon primus]UPR04753.1 aldo/keto reductase [Chloropicon primus]|eukprot:QDZ25556.1 aldo/keto reductase [Chloropicon primus]